MSQSTTPTVPFISSTPLANSRVNTVDNRRFSMSSNDSQGSSKASSIHAWPSAVTEGFPMFCKFPVELQMMVWELVPFKPRWLVVNPDGLKVQLNDRKPPALLHVCRLSREIALKSLVKVGRIIDKDMGEYSEGFKYQSEWWQLQLECATHRTVPYYIHPNYDIFWTNGMMAIWHLIEAEPPLEHRTRRGYMSPEDVYALVKETLPNDLDPSLIRNTAIGPFLRPCKLDGYSQIRSRKDLINRITAVFPKAQRAIFAWRDDVGNSDADWVLELKFCGPTTNRHQREWFDVVDPTSELAQSGPTVGNRPSQTSRLFLYSFDLTRLDEEGTGTIRPRWKEQVFKLIAVKSQVKSNR
ncbi:hypothetical protein V8F20_010683 [Naviculisporaceae sp. PSN 640]